MSEPIDELQQKHKEENWDTWHELFLLLRADNPTRSINDVIDDILVLFAPLIQRKETEAREEMRNKIESLIKEFDGGESNPNGGRNTEMTGHGALDFVHQAERELAELHRRSEGEK